MQLVANDSIRATEYPGRMEKRPSGKNIPETQRGDERVIIRARPGTKARISSLMARGGYAKLGDVLEAALEALEKEPEK